MALIIIMHAATYKSILTLWETKGESIKYEIYLASL
jgi:hypothetical protein